MLPMALALLSLSLLPAAHAADGFDLLVDDVAGLDEPWPLVGGVPLPEGAVRDPLHIRVVDRAGREMPAQVDVAATYRDGSIRWALLSLVASPTAEYRVEFGENVRRTEPTGITLRERDDGALVVDTGARVFVLPADNLVMEGALAYLVDNQGREARCAGPQAQIDTRILKAGPLRVVARREGWYIADDGSRIARGIAYMEFFARLQMVKLTHTLVFTEDTNALWVRDYGISFPAPAGSAAALFDTSPAFDDTCATVALNEGERVSLLQSDYPHFAERDSRFTLARIRADAQEHLAEGAACGEWCHVSAPDGGLTVVVPDLAQQFPKELAVSREEVRVHLWPERSGRELDFRAATLVRDYWQSWADLAPGGAEALARTPSNAQGAAKTHDVWLMHHDGPADTARIARQAHALARPALVCADPAWTCATEAVGWPLHPRDEERFSAEEAMISDFWHRLMLPYRVFPMTGVIAFGCHPYLQYARRDGKWYADFYRLSQLVEYGIRRHVWSLYARSGERKYVEYARRFNRFAHDWEMAHWTAGSKIAGGFALGDIHKPFYWGTRSLLLTTDISGHDIENWLLEHYMTGDERALEATHQFGEALREHWDPQQARRGHSPFVLLRVITSLHQREWDAQFGDMARELAHLAIDMDSPNGLTNDMPYGALYKVDRNAAALYDYWRATGDDLAKAAFLKAMDYQLRFNLIPAPIEYQNAAAYLMTIAYRWTGDERYLRATNQLVQGGLVQEGTPLGQELAALPTDLDEADRLPYRGVHLNMHPTLGMPTALAMLAGAGRDLPPFPLVAKAFTVEPAQAILEKPAGEPATVALYFVTMRQGEIRPRLLTYPGGAEVGPEAGVGMDIEQRMESYAPSEFRHFHCRLTLPAALPGGLYGVTLDGPEEFMVQEVTAGRVALLCPEGFWLGGGGPGAATPRYFAVPPGLQELELFVGRPVTVMRPDGSVALEPKDENIGVLRLPVNGQAGAWSAVSATPARLKLLNAPPVVAFGTPAQMPVVAEAPAPATTDIALPPPEAEFAPGIVGQAAQLVNGRTLRFPRGAPLPEGGYEHFPGNRGTIEFWFRPHWSSGDIPFSDRQMVYRRFVSGGAINMYYRYGAGPVRHNLYSYVDLLTHGPLGRPGAETTGHIGAPARQFFRAGEWTHFAATWELTEGPRGTEGAFEVFVNGRRVTRVWDYPRVLSGREPYRLQEAAEQIAVGCPEGLLDELRISRVVRYTEDFAPPREPFAPDADTAMYLPFDGHARGLSGRDAVVVAH